MLNFDFLNIQPPKQANSSDLSKKTEAVKDFAVSKNREEFETRKANSEDVYKKKDTSHFAKVLTALTKPAAHNSFQVGGDESTVLSTTYSSQLPLTKTDDKAQFITAPAALTQTTKPLEDQIQFPIQDMKMSQQEVLQESSDDLSMFYTSLDYGLNTESDSKITEETLSKIIALNADIKTLLQTIKDSAPKVENPETLSVIAEETAPAREDILELFAFILNSIEPSGDGTQTLSADDQKALLEKIDTLLNSDDKTALLANFTPQQLTDLQNALERVLQDQQSNEDQVMLDALSVQIVALAPAENNTARQVQAKTDDVAVNETKSTTLQPDVTKSALPAVALSDKHFTQARYDGRYDIGSGSADSTGNLSDTDFKAALKDATSNPVSPKMANDNSLSSPNAQRFLEGSGLSSFEGALNSASQGSTLTTTTGAASSSSVHTFQSTLTNVVTQASSASYPHPATQAVVATIHKAVKAGQDTSIKLQLDPPELGRVEVKMSISKDAKTKIVLTAEKSETLHLLQKDSQILDRALQNAGLDTDQSSLSFELASDNQNFNNNRGGGHDQGGRGASGSSKDAEIIETVMDWHVDPNTGAMRYNALV